MEVWLALDTNSLTLGKEPRRCDESQSWPKNFGKEKYLLLLLGIKTQFSSVFRTIA
jgi:hypothetical protein